MKFSTNRQYLIGFGGPDHDVIEPTRRALVNPAEKNHVSREIT
ncbi:MAG: hypothetical protein ABIG44_01080 [Planctomycetota bacterium]